jgi:hypothetical protein
MVQENFPSGALKVNIKIIRHKDQVASQNSSTRRTFIRTAKQWQEALGKIDPEKIPRSPLTRISRIAKTDITFNFSVSSHFVSTFKILLRVMNRAGSARNRLATKKSINLVAD